MLTPTDVIKKVTPLNERSDDAERFIGRYTALLSHSFMEVPFEVTWTPHDLSTHSHFTVTADIDGFPYKPVFFLFFIASYKSKRTTHKEAEVELKRLLKEADTPITTIHGACVLQSRVSFYRYDRKLDIFTPESCLFQEKFFDFDMKEHDGAVRYLQAVEDVKNACREVLGELQTEEAYSWERSTWTERLMTIVFGGSWA